MEQLDVRVRIECLPWFCTRWEMDAWVSLGYIERDYSLQRVQRDKEPYFCSTVIAVTSMDVADLTKCVQRYGADRARISVTKLGEVARGVVKFFLPEKGYGFLRSVEGRDYHFDRKVLQTGAELPVAGDFAVVGIAGEGEKQRVVDFRVEETPRLVGRVVEIAENGDVAYLECVGVADRVVVRVWRDRVGLDVGSTVEFGLGWGGRLKSTPKKKFEMIALGILSCEA